MNTPTLIDGNVGVFFVIQHPGLLAPANCVSPRCPHGDRVCRCSFLPAIRCRAQNKNLRVFGGGWRCCAAQEFRTDRQICPTRKVKNLVIRRSAAEVRTSFWRRISFLTFGPVNGSLRTSRLPSRFRQPASSARCAPAPALDSTMQPIMVFSAARRAAQLWPL